jgi:vacuolar iron transporter family protein
MADCSVALMAVCQPRIAIHSGPGPRYTAAMTTAPPHTHVETHFQSGDVVRDVVIGMSDGLTVPFALAAGSIAMGLGGYLAARGDAEHYGSERLREEREIVERTRDEEEEIYEIFDAYGVERQEATPVLVALKRNPVAWVDFMMRFELGLEAPQPGRAWHSALTIALSYIVGGLIPLLPYMLGTPHRALVESVTITLLALLVFGAIKGRVTGGGAVRSGLQTALIGGIAAGAAYGLAHLLNKP